jgi:hypothetical protein
MAQMRLCFGIYSPAPAGVLPGERQLDTRVGGRALWAHVG